MEPKFQIPAAQYLRMSTEDQQYSIANQQAAIQTYAKIHRYFVVSTYADAGKSGIEIKHRKELRRLLSDVMSGLAHYKAILVYDVSRWGRFQDVDEAAHYEFLCKSAGVPVRYCAEQFDNDGSLASSMMKALKRTMAAEYSRELGIKVSAGQRRVAALGFRVVGAAGYGLRRMMVSRDGSRRLILKDGERKAIQTDRTILVPGPKSEVDCVRTIFELAAELRKTPREIANELNVRHMLASHGRPWDRSFVYRILTNEKYAGCNTYGKTTQELCSRSRVVEPRLWTTNPDAFVPIVSRETFGRVQKLIKKRGSHPERTDSYFVQGMKRVLVREGKLTKRILEKRFIFSHAYYKRFGSVLKAYELAGFLPPSPTVELIHTQKQIRYLRNDLYVRLNQLFSDRVRFISLPGQQFRQIAEIDHRIRVSIYLCRAVTDTSAGEPGWLQSSGEHGTAYVADLEAGETRIRNPRHFTLEEDEDFIGDWTADSKAVIVGIQRGDDRYGLFKQSLDSNNRVPIAANVEGGVLSEEILSPDGKWIIALVWPAVGGPSPSNPSAPLPLVRIPVAGGTPEPMFQVVRPGPYSCARAPSNLCVVPEQTADHKQVTVTAFDPIKGRGAELARFDLDPNMNVLVNNLLCILSPDGTRLAFARSPDGPIEIRSLRRQPPIVIRAKGLDKLWNIHWAADSKALLVAKKIQDGTELLHVDLQGKTTRLWKSIGPRCFGIPSPDGRHLAVYDWKRSSNMWLMENF